MYLLLVVLAFLASGACFITAIDRSPTPERFFVLSILLMLSALTLAAWRIGDLLESRFRQR